MLEKEYNVQPFPSGDKNADSPAITPIIDFLPSHETGPEIHHAMLENLRSLDALVIFEGNTVIKSNIQTIKPTSFNDEDDYGTLGGGSRALAAAVAAGSLGAELKQLLFAGGNPVNKERSHGGNVHSGSAVYQQTYEKFLDIIRSSKAGEGSLSGGRLVARAESETASPLIRDTSENSYGDIVGTLDEASKRGWKTLGFLSNQYHLPRLKKLLEKAVAENPLYKDILVKYLSAEDVVLALSSEKAAQYYERLFAAAYATPGMSRRIEAEQRGIADIDEGRYKPGVSKASHQNNI